MQFSQISIREKVLEAIQSRSMAKLDAFINEQIFSSPVNDRITIAQSIINELLESFTSPLLKQKDIAEYFRTEKHNIANWEQKGLQYSRPGRDKLYSILDAKIFLEESKNRRKGGINHEK